MNNFGNAPIKMEGALVEGTGTETFRDLDAARDLREFLREGEIVEAVVFGEFGWGGFHEDELFDPMPKDKRGVVLTWEEAQPLMKGWTCWCGYGAPLAYAMYVWTNQRVIWLTQYDGSTSLDSAPRNPVGCMPDMPGG